MERAGTSLDAAFDVASSAYFNLRRNLRDWTSWLVTNGPILAALNVDEGRDGATAKKGRVDRDGATRDSHISAGFFDESYGVTR